MLVIHKNITDPNLHEVKGFASANNGDYGWKNEKGVWEFSDELVLPAALDFVDASVAPPTTNTGDIYVLSTGGSVNAGWGGAAGLKDWVRYDGTDWNVITPQKSTLCYNEDDDSLYSFNGTDWIAVGGGDNMANADLTLDANRSHDLNGFNLDLSGGTFLVDNRARVGTWSPAGTPIASFGNKDYFGVGSAITQNQNGLTVLNAASGQKVNFNINNATYGGYNASNFYFGASSPDGLEDILFKGRTRVKGLDNLGTSYALEVRNNSGTDLFNVRNDGSIYVGGVQGFTGTGAYTNFTISNGIITSAT